MADSAFLVFMNEHPPIGELVVQAQRVLWRDSALAPSVKEEMRIAGAEAVGCSYCTRFRTERSDGLILDEALSAEDQVKAEVAKRFVTALARGAESDELTLEAQALLTEPEFTDLVFSAGWFIGMQHVGRLMHWDNSCPVAPIRELVESGQAV